MNSYDQHLKNLIYVGNHIIICLVIYYNKSPIIIIIMLAIMLVYTPIADSMTFHFAHTTPHNKTSNKKQISGTKRTSHYFCDHCKISGHFMERCFKIHGYPKHTKSHNQKVATIAST